MCRTPAKSYDKETQNGCRDVGICAQTGFMATFGGGGNRLSSEEEEKQWLLSTVSSVGLAEPSDAGNESSVCVCLCVQMHACVCVCVCAGQQEEAQERKGLEELPLPTHNFLITCAYT